MVGRGPGPTVCAANALQAGGHGLGAPRRSFRAAASRGAGILAADRHRTGAAEQRGRGEASCRQADGVRSRSGPGLMTTRSRMGPCQVRRRDDAEHSAKPRQGTHTSKRDTPQSVPERHPTAEQTLHTRPKATLNAAEQLCCVPSMLDSLGVKVSYPTRWR